MFKTRPSNTGDVGSIPGWGAMFPHGQKKQNTMKQRCNKFNKDFEKKKSPHQNNLKKKIVIVNFIGSSLEVKVAR